MKLYSQKCYSFFCKIISVFICFVIVSSIAQVSDAFGLLINSKAEEMPEYNPEYGKYESAIDAEGNTVLTATPYENCGFRGWYHKDGTEVAYTASYTIPKGNSADDYIPVFYCYNLLPNGNFEDYEIGTNFKTNVSAQESWNSIVDNSTMIIDGNNVHNGSKALKIGCPNETVYRTFSNLDKNTQYTVSFWYNIESATSGEMKNYLSSVFVIADDFQITTNTPYLAKQNLNEITGTCSAGEWKKATVTFYTNENTSIKLCLLYVSSDGAELFIDDICLVKDLFVSPKYVNEDFSNGASYNWSAFDDSYLSVITENQRLKISSDYNYMQAHGSPMFLKKGAKYNFSFKLDMSEVEFEEYVPQKNGKDFILDANGNYQFDTSAPNWINFNISNSEKVWGKQGAGNLVTDNPKSKSVKITLSDINGTTVIDKSRNYAAFGFGKKEIKNEGLDPSNIIVQMEFIPDVTGEYYFNTRLNSSGTYYIDDLKITESILELDPKEYISNSFDSLGTAIRTVGKQGMRYKTEIDKRLLAAEMYYGMRLIEYGTIAIKTEYLSGSELVLDGVYDYNNISYGHAKGVAYSFSEKKDLVYAIEPDKLHFTGVLINIAEKNWNVTYTARAYFKYIDENGNEGVFYSDAHDIAVYPISKMAYSAKDSNGNYKETAEVREYLHNNIISKFTDKIIKINNGSSPISSNFEGIRSTVYHGVTFFPSNHGRTYTEQQAAIEMDRLVDTKVDNVRTRFDSHWMWEDGNGWNWNSAKMVAFYKWAKMLQDRDITITLNAGWHLHDFIYYYDKNYNNDANNYDSDSEGHSSIPEVDYLHGIGAARYGEDANAITIARYPNLNLNNSEKAYFSVVAARYSEWIKQALLAFKANGINNVEYILPFTETGYHDEDDPTYSCDEWIMMTMALHDALIEQGIREDYKLIGPSQAINVYQNREVKFVEYIYDVINGTDYEDMIDIISMHQYTTPDTNAGYNNDIYDPYACYSTASKNFPYYKEILSNAGVSNKEFWCDEYFASANNAKSIDGVGMQMTQFAAGLTAGINNGVNRFSTWQMFDTLWDSTATHSNGDFLGGIHVCGTCPSLVKADGETCSIAGCGCKDYTQYSSVVPRTTYYGINLIGKYLNNKNADVYATEVVDDATKDGGGVYVSAIKNDLQQMVILVVNTKPTISRVDLQFEKSNVFSFKRYTYDPSTVIPTQEAKSIASDGTITLNYANQFQDIIPAGSFSIYVSTKVFNGDDLEIPVE